MSVDLPGMKKVLLGYRWCLLAVLCVGLLLAFQIWSGNHARQRIESLQEFVKESYATSLGLTRALGYGGLIHHFKNHILRPDESQYLADATQAADNALQQVQGLEDNAQTLGISVTLNQTRAMIAAYTDRLEKARALVGAGLSPGEVDARLRFNDRFALREIDDLLDEIRVEVANRVVSIGAQGSTVHRVSSIATILLSTLLLSLVYQRSKRIRDLQAIRQLNDKLSESNASLAEANTSLKQFAGIVSHDLKTPLRHVGFFMSLIDEDIDKPAQIKKHVSSVERSIARLDRLIASLLDFTKTGFTEPTFAQIRLNDIAAAALTDLQSEVTETSARITTDLPGTVYGDADLLARVLQNLIANSLKYTRPGQTPVIHVESREQDGNVTISVTDDGIGIAPEFAERVFEPFQRLHTMDSAYKGCGIGLSLVRTVVQAHGGNVSIDKDFTGGTRVLLILKRQQTVTVEAKELELA